MEGTRYAPALVTQDVDTLVLWKVPEQISDTRRRKGTKAADLFSLGIVTCEVANGLFPYHAQLDTADTTEGAKGLK